MEIKINKEIRDYNEAIYFGLSLRQFIFSLLAVGVAVGLYFLLRPRFGMETVSWMCILGAAPFAALGFVKYHGMPAEKFLLVWFRSEFLEPKRLLYRPTTIYYELTKDAIRRREKALCRGEETGMDKAITKSEKTEGETTLGKDSGSGKGQTASAAGNHDTRPLKGHRRKHRPARGKRMTEPEQNRKRREKHKRNQGRHVAGTVRKGDSAAREEGQTHA